MKHIAVIAFVVLSTGFSSLVSGSGVAQNHPPSKGTRFPGSRMTPQGEVFLTWPFPVREWFVESAFAGFKAGYDEACHDRLGGEERDKNSQMSACPSTNRLDNKAIAYAKQMTEFYTRYPSDRDLPLNYLIRMLLAPKPKTLEEIHQSLGSTAR